MPSRSTVAVAIASMFRSLDDWEMAVLRRFFVIPERPRLRKIAVVVNHFGNGWLYAAIGVAMPVATGARGWELVRSLAVSLALGFSMYPFIKKMLARVRPCDAGPDYDAGVRPLDRYSCPSGHSMTASMFAVALALRFPSAAPLLVGGWLAIGWSRLALGHHYPSDVVFGGVLGGVISGVVCLWIS